jgi:class 3 adenylate cyclase
MINLSKNKKYNINLFTKSYLFFIGALYFLILAGCESSGDKIPKEKDNCKYFSTVIISVNDGLLIYSQQGWSELYIPGRALLCKGTDNEMLFVNEFFVGKLTVGNEKGTQIDTIISKNKFSQWNSPSNFANINNHLLLYMPPRLFELKDNSLHAVDSMILGFHAYTKDQNAYKFKPFQITINSAKNDSLKISCPYLTPDKEVIDILIYPQKNYSHLLKILLLVCLFALMLAVVIIVIYKNYRTASQKIETLVNQRISYIISDKAKAEDLLAKLLPKEKVDELKNTGKASSQKFEMVTVLFSDIQGFTKIAEQMNPEILIDELDNFFFHFDSVVDKYNIEKIKTIGDAYMCAGGIPLRNRTNPVEVVMAAIEMQDYMNKLKEKNVQIWGLRIGIHTGAVIAGVVGNKRMSYDIWGDTVNTASRMESSGEAGKVNISGQTYDLIKDFFICEYRGRMPVKYKGEIDMFFVKGLRPGLCEPDGITPNYNFFLNLQLLRIYDLEYHIIDKLTKALPDGMYFHNASHTEDVFTQTELLGHAEDLPLEDVLITRTAALLLDTGYTSEYDNPKINSIRFAKELLPQFKYSETQIEQICQHIDGIYNPPQHPSKSLGVLLDAYHSYLGRQDYLQLLLHQYNELKSHKGEKNLKDWMLNQIKLLKKTEFHTSTGKILCELTPEEQELKVLDFLKKR